MKGYKTSFVGMFQPTSAGMPAIDLIEIPLIQRDYAQGRRERGVDIIRRDFLTTLVSALTGGPSVDLDFVYGEISAGTLRPLDGQQRLTTLFLLHWFVAARLGRLEAASGWLTFSYATRPTAELFCRRLVSPAHAPGEGFGTPSTWITDQPWYLFDWRRDPTVQSMLVMLDAIHERLDDERIDLAQVWNRLVDTDRPAVAFHLLPIDDLSSGEDLYITMNSRGKPLTEFETFKARFERILEASLSPERFTEIVHKIDGVWTDVLWPFRGDDRIVDDEFLRYFEFVIEICEWRRGEAAGGPLLDRAERVFAGGDETDVRFLFHAFDTWLDGETGRPLDLDAVFSGYLTTTTEGGPTTSESVLLFDATDANLFRECCRRYGEKRGRARVFSLAETLMLFAVLIHRQFGSDDVQTRLRVLRNLTDRADGEVREDRMSELVRATEVFMRTGDLGELRGFNSDRVRDEVDKRAFVTVHGELGSVIRDLEDHPFLRGRLFAFDLDAERLRERAEVFRRVTAKDHWPRLTAALLAAGDYGIERRQRSYEYGSCEQEIRWRNVFTWRGRGANETLRSTLNTLLDAMGSEHDDIGRALADFTTAFVVQRRAERRFDWRYYLVEYDEMREGKTGIYFGEHLRATGHWEYSMCMLRTESLTGSAYYRDPYLLASWRRSEAGAAVHDPWFHGYESEPRWLRLARSEGGIRCVTRGFELDPPYEPVAAAEWRDVCVRHGADAAGTFLPIDQTRRDGETVDTEDRVQRCAALLTDLAAAGL